MTGDGQAGAPIVLDARNFGKITTTGNSAYGLWAASYTFATPVETRAAINMSGGSITGTVNLGGDNDSFTFDGGRVVGAVMGSVQTTSSAADPITGFTGTANFILGGFTNIEVLDGILNELVGMANKVARKRHRHGD